MLEEKNKLFAHLRLYEEKEKALSKLDDVFEYSCMDEYNIFITRVKDKTKLNAVWDFKKWMEPLTLARIKEETFLNCDRLEYLILPDDLPVIKERTFYNCKNLKRVDLPVKFRKICKEAFAKCSDLMTIKMYKNVQEIEENAFAGCNVKQIIIDKEIENLIKDSLEKIGIANDVEIKMIDNVERI